MKEKLKKTYEAVGLPRLLIICFFLALLLSSRGKIFSREEILRQVWSDEVIVLDRTIDVNITRLRRKIGPYGEHIVTRLGYGYGFEE